MIKRKSDGLLGKIGRWVSTAMFIANIVPGNVNAATWEDVEVHPWRFRGNLTSLEYVREFAANKNSTEEEIQTMARLDEKYLGGGSRFYFVAGTNNVGKDIKKPSKEASQAYDSLIERLSKIKGSELQKIRTIYREFVKLRGPYNHARAALEGHDFIHPASLMFENKSGVCRDMALALAMVYQDLGINAKYVTSTDHAWVRIDPIAIDTKTRTFDVDPTAYDTFRKIGMRK